MKRRTFLKAAAGLLAASQAHRVLADADNQSAGQFMPQKTIGEALGADAEEQLRKLRHQLTKPFDEPIRIYEINPSDSPLVGLATDGDTPEWVADHLVRVK